MKMMIALVLAALLAASLLTVSASAEEENWAYAGLALNNGNVGTIWYAKDYFALDGIVNPVTVAPYTAEELAAIAAGAVAGAEGYRFDVPAGAILGMGAADGDTVFWYDAESTAAIISHADPLTMNANGVFVTAEGVEVAGPIAE